jgi:hypothetical protein
MINQQSDLQSSFSTRIHSANKVLNCSLETIKQMFVDYEVYETDYIFKEDTEKYLEIRFACASLICTFTDELCMMSYLFLDDLEKLNEYINCCNDVFAYDYVSKEWQITNGTAAVKSHKEDVYFVFCNNRIKSI